MTFFAQVQIDQASFTKAEQFLTRVDFELRTKVLDTALKAAAAPVIKRAEKLAPDSVKSGSRGAWSNKTRARRAGTAQHKNTIGRSAVRNYGAIAAIYVGPLHPAGNLINVIGFQHEQVLWGRHTGATLPPTEYLQQASEQTKDAQQAAFVAAVERETDKILAKANP